MLCLCLPRGAAASQTRPPLRACRPLGSSTPSPLPPFSSVTPPPPNPHTAPFPSELHPVILNQNCRHLPCCTVRFLCHGRSAAPLLFSTPFSPSSLPFQIPFDSGLLLCKHHVARLHVSVCPMSHLQALVLPIPFIPPSRSPAMSRLHTPPHCYICQILLADPTGTAATLF